MTNALQVFDYKGATVRTVEIDGDVWLVAKDVCDVLGIANARDAVSELDSDEKNTVVIADGNRGNPNMNVINEPGLYKLTFKSRKPEAKEFTRWVTHEVLPQIRKTGSYGTPPKMNREEYELRMKALDDRRRDLDLRGAQILQSMLDNNTFPCTSETRTVFSHEIFKLVTGHEYLAMLPESTEKWYRATEIGEILGISANKVGRIAKEYGIKAPEGESNEYGRWIFSKSKYSSREVASFIYSEMGLDWFKMHFRGRSASEILKQEETA